MPSWAPAAKTDADNDKAAAATTNPDKFMPPSPVKRCAREQHWIKPKSRNGPSMSDTIAHETESFLKNAELFAVQAEFRSVSDNHSHPHCREQSSYAPFARRR
jgi:hypothetical protein